jgi:hypothetical protein
MSQPDLTHSLKKRYALIKKQEGMQEAMLQLLGERALIRAAAQQGRLSPEEAQEMMSEYDQVEASLQTTT